MAQVPLLKCSLTMADSSGTALLVARAHKAGQGARSKGSRSTNACELPMINLPGLMHLPDSFWYEARNVIFPKGNPTVCWPHFVMLEFLVELDVLLELYSG